MAIVKLKREAPESCLGEEETGETPTATELRLPLPFELRRGAEDFSRMVLGMPPGGLYEAYKIFDHSVLTRSADAYLLDEDADEDADALFGDDDDDADDDDAPPDGDTASGADANEGDESLGDGAAVTATNAPRKAAAEKVATE